jgi:hypothetical protein
MPPNKKPTKVKTNVGLKHRNKKAVGVGVEPTRGS